MKTEWITIGYEQIPKEIFDKYGIKPFQIMKGKMRDGSGKVWSNISYYDALKECEKLGFRMFGIREALVLLEAYKNQKKKVSIHDKEFLGIGELGYDEDVCFEWIEMSKNIAFIRGGYWNTGADAGSFALGLTNAPSYSDASIGFRCCREIR